MEVRLLSVCDVTVDVAGLPPREVRRQVLHRFTVEVPAGAVVAVAGPHRFGGTTAARVVAGLVIPNTGTVLVDGTDVTAVAPGRRPTALVPAGGGLFPHLTASENIVYGLRLRNEASVLIHTRVADVVERLELQSSLDLRPHELSPGQRLRTALARAAIRSAPVLVVDATAGAEAVEQIRPMVERVRRDADMAVLLCTHQAHLLEPTDRVVLMTGGRVTARGTLAGLRRAPADLATAELVYGPELAVHRGVVAGDRVDCGPVRIRAVPGLADGAPVHVAVPPRRHPPHGTSGADRYDAPDAGRQAISGHDRPGTSGGGRQGGPTAGPAAGTPATATAPVRELDPGDVLVFDAATAGAPLVTGYGDR
jgi:ABC-type sugar transport system ATPase subunit